MSRSQFRKINILELIKQKNFCASFIDNLGNIISQYDYEEFCETLKLADIKKLVILRNNVANLFHQSFNTKDDLSLKYRKGENSNNSISSDIFILSHCIVDNIPSKQIDEIFNIKIKPSLFLEKKEAQSKKINFIFRQLNLDLEMDEEVQQLSDSQKIDKILNSVMILTNNYEKLNNKVDNMKSSFDQEIKTIKQEMESNNKKDLQYQVINSSPNNIIDLNKSHNSDNSSPGNVNKKRKTINVSYKLKTSNQENNSKEYNSFKRKKTIIKGDQDNTGIATAGRVFELYIGGISQEENEDRIKAYFQSKNIHIIELIKINTRIPKSNAFKATIPKGEVHIIYDKNEKWPINMILNKFTPPNLNKIFSNRYNSNNGQKSYQSHNGHSEYNSEDTEGDMEAN